MNCNELLFNFPGDFFPDEYRIKDDPDPDVRISQEESDKMVDPKNEFYDDEKDNDKDTNIIRIRDKEMVVPEVKEP